MVDGPPATTAGQTTVLTTPERQRTRSGTRSNTTRSHSPVAANVKARHHPPFSRKFTKSLFVRPAHTRGPAPSYKDSVISAFTYSWVNALLVFNPIAWALHYTHQNDGAVFATALLGVMPLAGLLGHGTETIAMYTGDALGGLINASLGNATEFIIAILLLVKCEIRVVQASLLGGLLSNLLLVTGMAFLVGGIRFSEQEFQQTAAQLNTSLMTLAVIALVLPTVFAIAIEQASGEDQEKSVILEMSRGCALILIIIYILHLVFQLYSHAHLYNPDVEVEYDTPSNSSESLPRAESPANVAEEATDIPAPLVQSSPPQNMVVNQTRPSLNATTSKRLNVPRPPPNTRANSLPFGSAAALGRGDRGRIVNTPPPVNGRMFEKQQELRLREKAQAPLRDEERAAHNVRRQGTDVSDDDEEKESPEMNLPVALAALAAATGLTYVTAEALTDSLEGIGNSTSVTKEWLGLILLAIVGNAAEHITAVFVAYRNKVDLALAVSVGSCIQIALFVIPLLVLIGWITNIPLSLLFDPLEVVTLFLSVLLVRFATEDGRTHYMSGVTLFGSYILIAFAFWFYPQNGTELAQLFDTCS